MANSVLFRSKRKRFFVAALAGLAIMIPLLFTFISTFFLKPPESQNDIVKSVYGSWSAMILIGLSILAAVIFLIFKSVYTYRKLTFDPTWILRFQDTFEGERMEGLRDSASRTLAKYKTRLTDIKELRRELAEIDGVLDFFEDIGFYMQGDQVSPEVVHHHFYYWIKGYWIASQSYVKAWQAKDPTRWEYLEMLFETTCEVEVRRGNGKIKREDELTLTSEKLNSFLDDEIQTN